MIVEEKGQFWGWRALPKLHWGDIVVFVEEKLSLVTVKTVVLTKTVILHWILFCTKHLWVIIASN